MQISWFFVQKLFTRLDSDQVYSGATSAYRLIVAQPNSAHFNEPHGDTLSTIDVHTNKNVQIDVNMW